MKCSSSGALDRIVLEDYSIKNGPWNFWIPDSLKLLFQQSRYLHIPKAGEAIGAALGHGGSGRQQLPKHNDMPIQLHMTRGRIHRDCQARGDPPRRLVAAPRR